MALHDAAKNGGLAGLRRLIAAGAKINATDRFLRTPLHWACIRGHPEVVRELLSGASEINARDSDGMTPLHWACRWGHLEIVIKLLERGPRLTRAIATTGLRFTGPVVVATQKLLLNCSPRAPR